MKFFIALFLLVIPLACSNSSDSDKSLNSEITFQDHEIASLETPQISKRSPSKQNETPQKLIKESYIKFETKNLNASFSSISNTVAKYNGYIQEDASNTYHDRISRHLIVRIPNHNFDSILASISKDVSFFDSKTVSSKDVTEQFIDLQARLKAKLALEQRYTELLSKAKTVKEILDIERELSKIREEIESKQGQLQYLQNRISYSTITIEFYKIITETKPSESYGSKMWNAIVSGFNGISKFFIGLLYIWPFILLSSVAVFFFRKWLKKRQ